MLPELFSFFWYTLERNLVSVSDSDWDFLILVDGSVSEERTDRIRDRLYDIELESGAVLSSIVRSRDEWESPRYRSLPFHQRVEQDPR